MKKRQPYLKTTNFAEKRFNMCVGPNIAEELKAVSEREQRPVQNVLRLLVQLGLATYRAQGADSSLITLVGTGPST